MKKKEEIKFMAMVAEDLIKLKFKPTTTLQQALKMFYRVMRKHRIKQGTKEGNGIRISNYEWTMCVNLFLSTVKSHFDFGMLLGSGTPKDLQHY
jgi:hypothetical protein